MRFVVGDDRMKIVPTVDKNGDFSGFVSYFGFSCA